jgi:protein TonB
MFQSVIDPSGLRSGRFGTSAGVSVLLHAGVLAAALFISAGVAEELPKEPPVVTFKVVKPPKGNPNPPAVTPQPPPKQTPPRRRRDIVAPAVIPPPQPETDPAPSTPEPGDPNLPHVPGGHPDGDPVDGDLTAPPPVFTPELPTDQIGVEAIPFDNRMSMPRLLSGNTIEYTQEARQARVRGTLIAKCIITREGDVENCRLIKGVPYMDQEVLSALESRRYRPVTFQGEPVSVSYTFTVRLEMTN